MAQIDSLPPLRDVIKKYELQAKKSLGQNFLLDLNLTSRIARAAGTLHDHDVLEIGPGPGGLTRALLAEGARKVIAIERDSRALCALDEISTHYPGRLEVLNEDALNFTKWDTLQSPIRIVANLPYNIATPLLIDWLTTDHKIASMTLMFQREVAERIVALPNTKNYGRLSIISQWRCETKILFDIDPRAFVPAPKVVSSVVHFVPRENWDKNISDNLQRLTMSAFGQRRKMLRQSLKALNIDLEKLFAENELSGTERAENLSVAQFVKIAQSL